MHLHIFHTNDVHSELDRFARLAARLRRMRADLVKAGHVVLTFDIGDHIDTVNPLSRATEGLVNARALRALDYDGWVFGNNETLTLDRQAWPALLEAAGMPLYCGNVDLALPSHVAERFDRSDGSITVHDGVRVGVCGVTVYFDKHFPALGIAASDPVPRAFEQVNRLRTQGADIVIVLSHLGLRADQQMAEAGLDADIILGAHTHQFVEDPQRVGRAYIMQAGKYAMALGHVDVTIEGGRVAQVRGRLLPTLDTDPPDAEVLDVARSCRKPAQRWLAQPVASVAQPLRHSVCGESAVVNLIADRIRKDSGADVALVNGGVVAGSLRAGTIRRRDVLAGLYPDARCA
ncbi:MAG: 5'-nucleotidase C-terminal domain-containing protein, partial [Firmicutes bacterium]|nr:5'-nucleotidase C-terminal domain-containing protein [Bacillota bacterium]